VRQHKYFVVWLYNKQNKKLNLGIFQLNSSRNTEIKIKIKTARI